MGPQRTVIVFVVASLLEPVTTVTSPHVVYNVALYKPADQSSTEYLSVPERGNDGSRFITHFQETGTDNPAWWMVDLLTVHVVESIFLTNNLVQWYADKLNNFRIDIFITDPRQLPDFPNITGVICYNQTSTVGLGNYTWPCRGPTAGRYVRIIKTVEGELAVLEIEVHARHQQRQEMTFKVFQGRRYDTSQPFNFLRTVSSDSCLECTTSCLRLLMSDRGECSVANWTPATGDCEMFLVDTRNVTAVMSRLFPSLGTVSYVHFV